MTGIVTNRATLTRLSGFKLSLWCPHCVNAHMIAGKDASISWLDLRLAHAIARTEFVAIAVAITLVQRLARDPGEHARGGGLPPQSPRD